MQRHAGMVVRPRQALDQRPERPFVCLRVGVEGQHREDAQGGVDDVGQAAQAGGVFRAVLPGQRMVVIPEVTDARQALAQAGLVSGVGRDAEHADAAVVVARLQGKELVEMASARRLLGRTEESQHE